VKLYIWESRRMLRESGYPCSKACQALSDAGHWPKGATATSIRLWHSTKTPGRRAVKRLGGNSVVPADSDG
jgi:hypothetical protein